MSLASWKGRSEIVEILVQAEADVNIQGQVNSKPTMLDNIYKLLLLINVTQAGLTALMLATQKGNTNTIKTLLDGKADPNITDEV